MFRDEKVWMLVLKEEQPIRTVRSGDTVTVDELDQELYDELKKLRSSLAKEKEIPAYTIFSNATLADMARKKPTNLTRFKKVSGVGELKATWYGKEFINRIVTYLKKHA